MNRSMPMGSGQSTGRLSKTDPGQQGRGPNAAHRQVAPAAVSRVLLNAARGHLLSFAPRAQQATSGCRAQLSLYSGLEVRIK